MSNIHIQWQPDFASALELSRKADKPMFVYFTAPGCTFCEIMANEAFLQPEIVNEINTRFVPVKINGREQESLAAQFQVRMYPTLAAVRASGEVLENWNGYKSLADFQAHLTMAKSKIVQRDL